uniref:Uncharacterized protein n=1 Tax=Pipistrellus kuhlii TaxID=59472 RepID=A0A7J7S437_PIPKU|nr:hypothetical protein mPipKuh1_010183 [Pipistrellus kuhlii]
MRGYPPSAPSFTCAALAHLPAAAETPKTFYFQRLCLLFGEGGGGFLTGSALVPPRMPRLAPLFSVPVHSPLVPCPPWALSVSPRTDGASFGLSALAAVSVAARSGRLRGGGEDGGRGTQVSRVGLVLPQAGVSSCSPARPPPGPRRIRGERRVRVAPSGCGCSWGLCPPALVGIVLAPSAPRKGGPGTAAGKSDDLGRRPGEQAGSGSETGPPWPYLAPAAPRGLVSTVEGPPCRHGDPRGVGGACRCAGVCLCAPAPADGAAVALLSGHRSPAWQPGVEGPLRLWSCLWPRAGPRPEEGWGWGPDGVPAAALQSQPPATSGSAQPWSHRIVLRLHAASTVSPRPRRDGSGSAIVTGD